MKTLTKHKKLEVANVCYANVSSLFATFVSSKMRGPNFTWERFPEICKDWASTWVFTHDIKGDKDALERCAEEYAVEIAQRLVNIMKEE